MNTNVQNINAKKVLAYVLLPGIIPRLKELGGSGFGYFAFLIANVFQGVRILPPGHAFLNYHNIGKYGVRDVLSTAANHIEFSRRNADQIIVFGTVLLALVLLVLQFALFIIAMFTGKAFADTGGAPFTNIFVTDNPENDLAFMMLDYVFGIPNLFGSHALENGVPTPFHQGLHDLFQFYNLAILLVGVLIFLYYVVVVVIETAQTGVPFGRRFSKIYAPLRLIAAIGLLVPLNYGFNASQYITFYIAKIGSSFATNGWILYNENLDNPLGTDNATLIAGADAPDLHGLMYYMSVYHTCREMYKIFVPVVWGRAVDKTVEIKPYVIVDGHAREFSSYGYDEAKRYFGESDIEIVMGELNSQQYGESGAKKHIKYPGGVRPYCGKMTVSLSSTNPPYYTGQATSGGHIGNGINQGGVQTIEKQYYYMLMGLFKTDHKIAAIGERFAHKTVPGSTTRNGVPVDGAYDPCWRSEEIGDTQTCSRTTTPPVESIQAEIDQYQTAVNAAVATGLGELRDNISLKLNAQMARYGWGGAGIWYNRVAELNGSISSAIMAAPRPKAYPEVMDFVKSEKQKADTATTPCEIFNPNLANHQALDFKDKAHDPKIAEAGYAIHRWPCERPSEEGGIAKGMTGNIFLDSVGVIFGINGLFQLREQTAMDRTVDASGNVSGSGMPKVHPLAALSAIGKALVENAIRSMATSLFFSFGGGLDTLLGPHLGAGLATISKMLVNISTIGLTAGFILYYILPFLPFIYFFFAVGSWVKSIFEAMVGAPLWALAHLRIDGDGFSGRAAAGGYFLLFEIGLRPIVTLFGLIGGMAVFGASVAVLNEIFGLVVGNIVGADPALSVGRAGREASPADDLDIPPLGAIDQFFFTIMYTILVYMIATACFKMIDTIPKQFMRWMGTQVSTFNDNTGDPTANLTQYTALAGSQIAPQVLGGLNQGASAAGKLVNELGKTAKGDGA